jgi:hypothetical protein
MSTESCIMSVVRVLRRLCWAEPVFPYDDGAMTGGLTTGMLALTLMAITTMRAKIITRGHCER